jgi:hypothetical protein
MYLKKFCLIWFLLVIPFAIFYFWNSYINISEFITLIAIHWFFVLLVYFYIKIINNEKIRNSFINIITFLIWLAILASLISLLASLIFWSYNNFDIIILLIGYIIFWIVWIIVLLFLVKIFIELNTTQKLLCIIIILLVILCYKLIL